MVRTSAGKSEPLVEDIEALPAVEHAHVVAGDWDVIAEVETEEVYDVLHTAASSIQELAGVTDTKTYVALG